MSIKDLVGAAQYTAVTKALQAAFPDPETTITESLVDACFQVAKYEWQAPSLANVNIPPLAATAAPAAPTGDFSYYLANATHTRTDAPHSSFTGRLPVVRYQLPQKGTRADAPVISTPAGELLPQDRLLTSIDTLWERFGKDKKLTFKRPKRVDVIAPPRLSGARFAAISLYLCYAKANDRGPSFYVLEAGLATGQARMLYLGRTMDGTLMYQTQYNPTAFSRPAHWYTGKLDMDMADPGEPFRLTVRVFENRPPTDQYLAVTVIYSKRSSPAMTNPFLLTIAAGARVQAIADALGVPSGLDEAMILRVIAALGQSSLFTIPPEKA